MVLSLLYINLSPPLILSDRLVSYASLLAPCRPLEWRIPRHRRSGMAM